MHRRLPVIHYEEVSHPNNGGKIIAHRVDPVTKAHYVCTDCGDGEEHFDEEIHERLPQIGARISPAPVHTLPETVLRPLRPHVTHIVHATPPQISVALNPPKVPVKPALIKAELKKVTQAAGLINKIVQAKVGEANRLVAKIDKVTAATGKSPALAAAGKLIENTDQPTATEQQGIHIVLKFCLSVCPSGCSANQYMVFLS